MTRCDCTKDDLRSDEDITIPLDLPDDWRCPRKTIEGSNRCIFHSQSGSTTGEAATKAVIESLSATPTDHPFAAELDERKLNVARKRFIGARFNTLILTDELIEQTDTLPVDFRSVNINTLDISGARIECDLHLFGASIESLNASKTTVVGSIKAEKLSIEKECTFEDSNITGDVKIHDGTLSSFTIINAKIGGRLELNNTTIQGDVFGTECIIDGRFEFKEGDVHGGIYCPGLSLRGEKRFSNTSELTFRGTSVESGVTLEHLRSEGEIMLNELKVGGDLCLDFAEINDSLWLGAVADESTTLGSVDVSGNLTAKNAYVGAEFDFAESEGGIEKGPQVGASIDFSGIHVEGDMLSSRLC
jgi:hypothetical protein